MPESSPRTRLTNLRVREVSLVDRPANEEPFLIIKRLEDGIMLRRTDSPIIKAAEAVIAKNDEQKASEAPAKKMDPAAMLDAIEAKVEGLADLPEWKALREALMGAAGGKPEGAKKADKPDTDKANKAEGEEDEEDDAAAKAAAAKKDEAGAAASPAAASPAAASPAAASGEPTLSEIRDTLAQLHAKLDGAEQAEKAAKAADEKPEDEEGKAEKSAIAKSLTALHERLERIEKTRGAARGEGDDTTTVQKGNGASLFAGLV